MANVWLIKDDEQPLILPASSITAVLAVKGEKHKDHEDAVSLVLSSFRGGRFFWLAQDAASVVEELKAKDGDPARWVVLDAHIEGEVSAFDRNTVVSYEGFAKGSGPDDERPWTSLYVERPGCEPRDAVISLSASDETREALNKILADHSELKTPRRLARA